MELDIVEIVFHSHCLVAPLTNRYAQTLCMRERKDEGFWLRRNDDIV